MRPRPVARLALGLGLAFALATPAVATPVTGAYVMVSRYRPNVQPKINLFDGVLELAFLPPEVLGSGVRSPFAVIGSLRAPWRVYQEVEANWWPSLTLLGGYQRQQSELGNSTNAIEVGVKAERTILPWLKAHAMLTNATVVLARNASGNIPQQLYAMPHLDLGASFHVTPRLAFYLGFEYWTAPEDLNRSTNAMLDIVGYPGLAFGLNWQLSELLGLPEPKAAEPQP